MNTKPSLLRYQRTWDVDTVLKYLKALTPVNLLSLKMLSYKLVMLLLLLTGQCVQMIHSLLISDITITDNNILINVESLRKCSKPGSQLEPIELPAFVDVSRLCVVRYLRNT